MIECDRVFKSYGSRRALDGVSLRVSAGEAVGLVGVNGAGKTTLLRILAGVLMPSEGHARIAGEVISGDALDARRRLAWVPDTPPVLDLLTAREHVDFVAAVHGVRDPLRVATALDIAGIAPEADTLGSQLSRGQRQRVSLACAMVASPAAILLDEPFLGLDPPGRRALSAWIPDRARAGAALLVSSHDLTLLEDACTRHVVIHEGRIVASPRQSDMSRGDLERVVLGVVRGDA